MNTLKSVSESPISDLETIAKVLAGGGVQISPARVPFTYHHDAVRSEEGLSGLSRADIAKRFQLLYPTVTTQKMPLLCGMFICLLRDQPAKMMLAIHAYPIITEAFRQATEFNWALHVNKLSSQSVTQ
jgi:hypothetical protein